MSILKFGHELDPKVEAEVIMTSAVLGFCVTRVKLGQPFSFDMEHPTEKVVKDPAKYQEFLGEWQQFLSVLSALSIVLEFNGVKADSLKDAQSPAWMRGARITGREGGAMVRPQERHKPMESPQALELAEDEASQPGGYFGRGAYTGMIDDPVNYKTFRQPTKRVIIRDPDRWHSGGDYHGLIKGPKGLEFVNFDKNPQKGMGPLNSRQKKALTSGGHGLVGYVHGMSWAMQECIKCGPWCTPYEQAVGSDTTKMASCFPCTTYMYAAGFPPSSAHLGRGESWAPLPEDQGPPYGAIAKSLNTRWHMQCHHYLHIGSAYLKKYSQAHTEASKKPYLDEAHRKALNALVLKLEQRPQLGKGGNLILDALTVHDSEWKRLYNTLNVKLLNDFALADAEGGWKTVQHGKSKRY